MKLVHVGFTGTRKGMTERQKLSVKKAFIAIKENADSLSQHVVFHHGCCVGADYDACGIALRMGFMIHAHPPTNQKHVFDYQREADFISIPDMYLVRNAQIVDSVSSMICCPGEDVEQRRSGTWATIRQAGRVGKRRMIIYPNGKYDCIKAG